MSVIETAEPAAEPTRLARALVVTGSQPIPTVLHDVLTAGGFEVRVAHLSEEDGEDVLGLTGDPVVDRGWEPDVLVNLLRHVAPSVPAESLESSVWQAALEANLTRTLQICQMFGPAMLAEGRGVIVTVLVGSIDDTAAEVLDAAVTGLMRVIGVEWAPHGVRVMTVAPTGAPGEARDRAVADVVAFLAGEAASYVTASEVLVSAPAAGADR